MITPNAEVAEATRRAQEGWQILKRGGEDFRYWIGVGQAINAFRRQLFHDLKINEPKGQAYKEAMGAYLKQNGWNQPPKWKPDMTDQDGKPVPAPSREQTIGIDDGVRSNLQHVIDHLAEIEAWRATQPLGDVLRQNHPNTVWRAFPYKGKGDNEPRPRQNPQQRLRRERDEARAELGTVTAENERLTAQVEELTARAETATAHAGYMWDDAPDKVAAQMVKAQPEKAIKLAEAIIGGNGVLRTPQELRSDVEAVDPREKFSQAFQRVVQLEAQSLAQEFVGFRSDYAKGLMLALRRLLEPKRAKKDRHQQVTDKLAPKGQTGGFAAKLHSEIAAINASLDTSEAQREA
jgi:hypothetical protein